MERATTATRRRESIGRGPVWRDLVERLLDVPDLPDLVRRLPEACRSGPDWEQEAAALLALDPEAARAVLRVAGEMPGAPRFVGSLPRAVRLVGPAEVPRLALAVAVHRVLRTWSVTGGVDAGRLWRHSYAVGIAADWLSRLTASDPFESFAAGLLHDLGKAVLDACLSPWIRGPGDPGRGGVLSAWEQTVLGATHSEVGAVLAARWRFPRAVTEAIRLHHVRRVQDLEDFETLEPAAVLIAADRLVHRFGIPGVAGEVPSPVEGLDLSGLHVGSIAFRLRNSLERMEAALGILARPRRPPSRIAKSVNQKAADAILGPRCP